jgi:two-component system, OmpR family, alkaline phosphatase synthesis response regulator PhoP
MSTQPTTNSQKPASSRPHRVLVVDDEAHIVQVLSLKLRNAGYEVLTAVDGEEAFELACRPGAGPDVVITDFQMPYMTGLELCRALKSNPATANVPVVMLTARGYALDAEDLQTGNIREVLSKPFSPRAIADLLAKLLGEKGLPAASAQQSADNRPLTADRSTKEAA